MTTLVIGARGSVGRHVLDQLLQAGEPVRASARDVANAQLPLGVDVVSADLTDAASLTAAMRDVRQVFVYSSRDGAEVFTTAAQAAGVEHVVLMSSGTVLQPALAANANTEEHRFVEEVLAGRTFRLTPVRPLVLANNALNWTWPIRDGRAVPLPYPDAATAPIHERDIAAVAVHALTQASPSPAVSDLLTGPERLSQRRQVQIIAEVTGVPTSAEGLSDADGQTMLSQFMPTEIAAAIIEVLAYADQGGSPATDTVQRVLSRAPASFEDWVADHAAAFRP